MSVRFDRPLRIFLPRPIPIRNSLDYSPTDAIRNKGAERPEPNSGRTTYLGPLRRVIAATVNKQESPIGEFFVLELECGHEIIRTTSGQIRFARCRTWCTARTTPRSRAFQ